MKIFSLTMILTSVLLFTGCGEEKQQQEVSDQPLVDTNFYEIPEPDTAMAESPETGPDLWTEIEAVFSGFESRVSTDMMLPVFEGFHSDTTVFYKRMEPVKTGYGEVSPQFGIARYSAETGSAEASVTAYLQSLDGVGKAKLGDEIASVKTAPFAIAGWQDEIWYFKISCEHEYPKWKDKVTAVKEVLVKSKGKSAFWLICECGGPLYYPGKTKGSSPKVKGKKGEKV